MTEASGGRIAGGARQRRRPTKQGTVLSEELIVDAALRLMREHGAGGLTARRLGAALGADPSALYRYFRSTDDLLLAVADELIGRALDGWTSSGEWKQDLREVGRRIHAGYLDHPQAAALASYRTTGRRHEARAIDRILGVLRGAGFPDAEAVRLYHVLVDSGMSHAAQDACWQALPGAAREAEDRVWDHTYTGVPAETHPHLAAMAPLLRCEMRRSSYPVALELFLDAAEARLRAADGGSALGRGGSGGPSAG
jgi:AcrR family transcriptional regulator